MYTYFFQDLNVLSQMYDHDALKARICYTDFFRETALTTLSEV